MKYSLFFFIFATIGTNTIVNTYPISKYSVLKQNNQSCNICLDVVGIISDEIRYANKSLNQIINVVEAICNISDPIIKPECDNILNEISYILKLITNGFNSTKICQMIHLCNYKLYDIYFNRCQFCDFMTSEIRTAIYLGNSTFNDLLDLIVVICRTVHTPVISYECEFLLTNIKNIEKWMFNGINNTKICDNLHFCNTTQFINSKNTSYNNLI